MLHRNRIDGDKNIVPFCMPLLKKKGEKAGGLSSAEFNTEQIEREAYEKGFESGDKAGFAMGEKKALVLIERLEGLLSELAGVRKTIIRELESQVVELAVGIARKIILKELDLSPDQIVEMTKEALSRIERTGQITIKINPSLHDLFLKHKPDILSMHPDVAFDTDPAIPVNGSVVIGPAEDIITDVDVQLKHLIKEMGERIGGN